MIAGCIDKMRRDACGGCERRDACADLFPAMFTMLRQRAAAAARPAREPGSSRPAFFSMLAQVAKAVEARAAQPRPAAKSSAFLREIEARLEPLLASGDISIDRIARDLGYGRQTLYRRLKAGGATYEQVLDGLRRRLALRYMREGLSVKDAAYRLGFSDPAAFSRAFKRWTGSSPSGMRTRH